jgi:hypothetical protein
MGAEVTYRFQYLPGQKRFQSTELLGRDCDSALSKPADVLRKTFLPKHNLSAALAEFFGNHQSLFAFAAWKDVQNCFAFQRSPPATVDIESQ